MKIKNLNNIYIYKIWIMNKKQNYDKSKTSMPLHKKTLVLYQYELEIINKFTINQKFIRLIKIRSIYI